MEIDISECAWWDETKGYCTNCGSKLIKYNFGGKEYSHKTGKLLPPKNYYICPEVVKRIQTK